MGQSSLAVAELSVTEVNQEIRFLLFQSSPIKKVQVFFEVNDFRHVVFDG